jgi:hypothetical protein
VTTEAEDRLGRNPETQAVPARALTRSGKAVEFTGADGSQFTVSGPPVPDEDDGTTSTTESVEPELSWSDNLLRQTRALDATAQAKLAVEAAAETEDEDDDPDKMNVVPNRKAKRDAANLRGSIRLNRSRVRRRIHRVLVKRGYWV